MKNQTPFLKQLPLLIGLLLWLLLLSNSLPYTFFELSHVELLLLAAPLCLLPLAWYIANKPSWLLWLGLSCGLFFSIAYQIPKGILAASFLIPSGLLVVGLAIQQILQSGVLKGRFRLQELILLAAYLYLPVGVVWAFIDRLGIPFMGYSPTIILLTAVHFHYAGFLLPLVTSLLIPDQKKSLHRLLSIGIILGVPLVALGISATHFVWPFWIEVVCVTVMTSAGMGVGLWYIRFGFRCRAWVQRICFSLGGLALIVGMLLAFCYGWRQVFLIETLTIPWMYAVHGTCNAIGFAAPVLLGWWHKKRLV